MCSAGCSSRRTRGRLPSEDWIDDELELTRTVSNGRVRFGKHVGDYYQAIRWSCAQRFEIRD
jgi:hypothetical protein